MRYKLPNGLLLFLALCFLYSFAALADVHYSMNKYLSIGLESVLYETEIYTSHRYCAGGDFTKFKYSADQAQVSNFKPIKKPIIKGVISGRKRVCKDILYTYTLSEEDPDYIYIWSVTNGEVIGDNTGAQVDVKFTSTPATVRVVKQFVEKGIIYSSEPIEFIAEAETFSPVIINDSGQEDFFPSNSVTFSLDIGETIPDHIEWEIRSSTGAKNFGNIIEGIYDKTVTVSFNEVSTSDKGILIVRVYLCGIVVANYFNIKLRPGLLMKSLEKPDCSEYPEPNTQFTIDSINLCAENTVTLSISDYNPSYLYEWIFNGTSFFASGTDTEIQLPGGDYPITLTITTPYGCTYTSTNNVEVIINEADFEEGTIVPDDGDFCDDSSVIPLTYSPVDPLNPPTDIIWMKGDQQVGTGMSYQPTESGSYWPVLIDVNGCKSYINARYPKSYILSDPPFASVSVSYGKKTTLYGITTDDKVEYRWEGPGLPAGFDEWAQGEINKVFTPIGVEPGEHEYTFYTRRIGEESCSNSFTMAVKL